MVKLSGAFLQTRLAQRALARFLAGTLLPATAAILFTYCQVSDQWIAEDEEDLAQFGKTTSLAVLHRLQTARSELEAIRAAWLQKGLLATDHHETPAVTLAAFRTSLLPLSDEPSRDGPARDSVAAPTPSQRQIEHLLEGRVALVVIPRAGEASEASVWLGIALDAQSRRPRLLWGRVRSEYLWADRMTSPQARPEGSCILDARMRPLRCDHRMFQGLSEALLAEPARTGTSLVRWTLHEQPYLTHRREVFLGYEYAAPSLHVLTTEPTTTFLGQAGGVLGLVGAGALVLAFLLTSMEARRSLDPIKKLSEGTQKVASGALDTQVLIHSRDEFADLARSFNEMTRNLADQFGTLETIREIDQEVLGARAIGDIADSFLIGLVDGLGFRAAAFVLLPSSNDKPAHVRVLESGSIERNVNELRISPDTLAELSRHSDGLVIPLPDARPYLALPEFQHASESAALLPLILDGSPAGVAAIAYTPSESARAPLGHARRLVEQLAVALANARLLELLDNLNWGTIRALGRSIDAKSNWTAGHTERVTRRALTLARRLGVPEPDLETLHRAALLHDIGKIGIPSEVLNKTDPLTEEDWRLIRAHPQTGADILAPIEPLQPVIPVVLHHHERWDGTGYPAALRGEDIPLLARILAVVDVFDALTSDRPYRSALSVADALRLIREEAGSHFDPRIAEAFIAYIREEAEAATEDQEAQFAVA